MKKLNPLDYLQRPDKWYLGGGNRLIWTPPFPVWLDYPGFWDKAHYYNRELEPVFTWTLLDDGRRELPLRTVGRTWDPSKLVTRFKIQDTGSIRSKNRKDRIALSLKETKCCLQDDTLTSSICITNLTERIQILHLVAWTTQHAQSSKDKPGVRNVTVVDTNIQYTKRLQPPHPASPPMEVQCILGISPPADTHSVQLSEGATLQPHWNQTPFTEQIDKGGLNGKQIIPPDSCGGLVYMALQKKIVIKPKSTAEVSVSCSVQPERKRTKKRLSGSMKLSSSSMVSEQQWENYFSQVPYFDCSDEYLTRYYWYRWYGLKLLTMDGAEGHYHHPFVCEGIGYFRAPISYSAMCHILENRWLPDPSLARGSLLTFIGNQRNDGGFRGYIDVDCYRQEMFYHANWGNSILELHRHHPDKKFLTAIYEGMTQYVNYFDRERDAKKSGLYDIDNHYETGQEYMHRYIAVNPDADKDNWGEVFRLKGVDVTVYLYELKKALSVIAGILGKIKKQQKLKSEADSIKHSVLSLMWDPREEMFFDVNPETGKRTNVKAATCFYPYLTDLVDHSHLRGLKRHLLNNNEFWTPYPVPSSSIDDAYYSPDAQWKGKRMNCPWNGRVWPMTNSHIAEALASSSVRFHDDLLKEKSVEFLNRYIRMMFSERNPERPNCYEHYNPLTGQEAIYRGVNDYQHSWVADLILKYVAGIRCRDRSLVIDPFPFALDFFNVENVMIRGYHLAVRRRGKTFTVFLSGKKKADSVIGQPVVISFMEKLF